MESLWGGVMDYAAALGALTEEERKRWERYVSAHAVGPALSPEDAQRLEATSAAYRSGDVRLSPRLHAVYRAWIELREQEATPFTGPARGVRAERVDSAGVVRSFADQIELRWPGVGWLTECTMVLRTVAPELPHERWPAVLRLNELVEAEMLAGREHIGAVLAQAAVIMLHAPEEGG